MPIGRKYSSVSKAISCFRTMRRHRLSRSGHLGHEIMANATVARTMAHNLEDIRKKRKPTRARRRATPQHGILHVTGLKMVNKTGTDK